MGGHCPECKKDKSLFCRTCGGIVPFEKLLLENSDEKLKAAKKELPKKYYPYYVYLLKEYLSTLDRTSQIVCFHHFKGIPKRITSSLLGISLQQIDAIIKSSRRNLLKFIKQCKLYMSSDDACNIFYNMLINSNIDDDEIADMFREEIGVIKVARSFALKIAN